MPTVWFALLAVMFAVYAMLDGFDLGVGALHRLLARTAAEREQAIEAIGPVWNGNEVWLIAGGGVLFLAFPRAYAAAFSGLYLGLIVVLWLLVGRGLGIELRHQLDNPLWQTACDTVFWLSSAAVILVFGIALGNVVQGVPLQGDGYFHMSVFDALNRYAVLVGVVAVVVLTAHGAAFLAAFSEDELAQRARRWARRLWWLEVLSLAGAAYPTYAVRPDMLDAFRDHPWRLVFPLAALAALALELAWQHSGSWRAAFAASCLAVAALLATAAAALYPNLLPAREGDPFSLTVHNAASSDHALTTALVWWPVGIALAAAYFTLAYRHLVLRRVVGAGEMPHRPENG
jgi:cytochrome bd ubiquinol oxidase subunit II